MSLENNDDVYIQDKVSQARRYDEASTPKLHIPKKTKDAPVQKNGLSKLANELLRRTDLTNLEIAQCVKNFVLENYDDVSVFAKKLGMGVERESLIAHLESIQATDDPAVEKIVRDVRNGTFDLERELRKEHGLSGESLQYLITVSQNPELLQVEVEEEAIQSAEENGAD
jgi:hypothetical protein